MTIDATEVVADSSLKLLERLRTCVDGKASKSKENDRLLIHLHDIADPNHPGYAHAAESRYEIRVVFSVLARRRYLVYQTAAHVYRCTYTIRYTNLQIR